MTKKTQEQQILEHLESGETITPWEAIDQYRITRLAAVVKNLRIKGHDIRTDLVQVGRAKKKVVRYWLYIPKPAQGNLL